MLDAYVYQNPNGFHVKLMAGGIEVDEAGPFDDETEAVEMAERAVFGGGYVHVGA